MPTLTILSQPGPLPITAVFNAPSDGPAALFISGSVWTQQQNSMIGIQVLLDGKAIGSATIFSNPSGTHMAVVPAVISVQLSPGAHKLVLTTATPATTSDKNDSYIVFLMY
jgi:hypothetical protein